MSGPTTSQPRCPLCHERDARLFHADAQRSYHRCRTCRLVFVPPEYFLTPARERAHYDLHENDPADPRYRAFLSRLCTPLLEQLPAGSHGLDFGCGPGPTLSVLLEEAGHHVTLYDPFYASNPQAFDRTYDFITASEVVEHLHDPAGDLQRLWSCLVPGGTLGIMTKLVSDPVAFRTWHYIQDPTHVCFYSTDTWSWLARVWSAKLVPIGADVVLLTKSR